MHKITLEEILFSQAKTSLPVNGFFLPIKKRNFFRNFSSVGVAGLEPTTPNTPCWYATNCATPRTIIMLMPIKLSFVATQNLRQQM